MIKITHWFGLKMMPVVYPPDAPVRTFFQLFKHCGPTAARALPRNTAETKPRRAATDNILHRS